MNPLLLVGGAGALASAILFGMWQWEKADHKQTLRMLDAETRRANVATTVANENKDKVLEMEKLLEERTRLAKEREERYNRVVAEKEEVLSSMERMKDKFHEYTNKKPAVAARAFRADLNRLFRELAGRTCRTDCESGDSTDSN